MIETLHPVLHKTPVLGLRCHIGKSGLCIGDAAHLHLTETGDVTLTAEVTRRYLGLFPYRKQAALGHLGPVIAKILAPAIRNGAPMRVRIVGLTPEHLCGPEGPEIYVSIWADPLVLRPLPPRPLQ
jgi:hypothetical protein